MFQWNLLPLLSGSKFFKTTGAYLYSSHPRKTHIINYLKPVIHHTTVTLQVNILQMALHAIKNLKHRTVPKWKCKIQIQISLIEADISDGLSQSSKANSGACFKVHHIRLFFKSLFNSYIIFASNICYYICNTLCTWYLFSVYQANVLKFCISNTLHSKTSPPLTVLKFHSTFLSHS